VPDLIPFTSNLNEIQLTTNIEPQKISDWVSIGIAALAFSATWWQAKIAREHNRISVTPMIVNTNDWDHSPTELVVSFVIKNAGIGVAIVTDRYFTYDEKRFIPQRADNVIEELCASAFKTLIPYEVTRTSLFGKNARIPPGTEITIARLIFRNPHPNLKDAIVELTSKIEFIIEYESLYKEKFRFSTNE
jgi:hypothetical protein